MITIFQIKMSNAQIDAFNAGASVPAIEAKRKLMVRGSKNFTPDMLRYFTAVADVRTNDLEVAFEVTNLWNAPEMVDKFGRMSSTSVGDIFARDGRFFMVDSFGFEELYLFNDEIEVIGEAA
jgi:hypothetical protein